ncbi:MAG: hypothetical protein IT286_04440, partial [Proteobacteria bacterium]|nr:hypothetical protein [Pseudomonadota bacterium]
MKNHVGSFNQKSCVEYGKGIKKLPEDKKELWKLVGNSYASIHNEYQKNLSDVIENAKEKTTEELLKDYIQSNPTSIQQALLATSSKPRAMSTCLVLHSLKRDNSMKEAVASVLSPVAMLATLMTGGTAYSITGSVVAYSALVLNTYFVGSTIMDVVASKNLESRIQGALLSEQIDPAVGKDMVAQLQSTRPMSYINIALGGLGATAAGLRAAKTSKGIRYQEYLVGKGGATAEGFARVSKSFVEKGSKPFTRQQLTQIAKRTGAGETSTPSMVQQMKANAKNAPQPQGVKHDLGGAKLESYLNFIKNEKGSGTGPSSNQPGSYGYTRPPVNQPGPSGGYKAVTTEPTVAQASKVQTSPTVAKPAPKNGVKAKMEVLPDVVPMPVEPYIVPMPVLPYVVEPAYAAKGNEKLKKDLEQKKKDLQRQAEQAIESDQDVADTQVRTIIENIAREQGRLGGLARDWLAKHGGLTRRSYDGGNGSDAGFNSSSKNSNNPYSMEQVLHQMESNSSDKMNYMMLGAIYELSQKDNELGQKARDWLTQHAGSSLQYFSVGAGENPFYALLIHNDPQHGDWDGTDIVLNMILAGKTRVDHGSLDGALRFVTYSGETKILKKVLAAANFQKQPFSSEEISRSFEGTGYYNYPGASSTKVRTENAKALVKYAQENNFSISMESIQRAMKASAQDPDKEFYEFCNSLLNPKKKTESQDETLGRGHFGGNANLFTDIGEDTKNAGGSAGKDGETFPTSIVKSEQKKNTKETLIDQARVIELAQRAVRKEGKYPDEFLTNASVAHLRPLILEEIQKISNQPNGNRQGNQDRDLAQAWIKKHPELKKEADLGQASISSKHASYHDLKKDYKVAKELEEIQKHHDLLMKYINDRNQWISELDGQTYLSQETVREGLRNDFFYYTIYGVETKWVQIFNEISRKIREESHQVSLNVIRVLKKNGFEVEKKDLPNKTYELLIKPTPKSKFYDTFLKYTKGYPQDSFILIFSPIEVHMRQAYAFVKDSKVKFGINTVRHLLENELLYPEQHEIRHLFHHLLRDVGIA